MGREEEPNRQGAIHIPPGYVTSTKFAINPRTGERFPIFVYHPSCSVVDDFVYDYRGAEFSIAWTEVEPSGPREEDPESWPGRSLYQQMEKKSDCSD